MHKRWYFYLVSTFIVVLDQATKFLASSNLPYNQPVKVLSVFNLTLAHNTGAAFSFLSRAGGWQSLFFIALASVMSVVLFIWVWRTKEDESLQAIALALILGGALGNLIDRVFHGYVIDFIQVHYQHNYFPIFNIADCAISIGTGLFVFILLFLNKQEAAI